MIGDEMVRKGTAWHNKKETKNHKAQKRSEKPNQKKEKDS
jgi:hypothetical protein